MPIQDGQKVLIIADNKAGRRKLYYFTVDSKQSYSTFLGSIRGKEIAEKNFGETIKLDKGYLYLIEPSLYDRIMYEMKRKSQVIYPKDSGYIASISGIRKGMKVLEAGIGSGFLTIEIAKHVCPDGKVYAYDIREDMIEIAKKNLEKVKFLDCVIINNLDIREGINEENFDSAFLDMADPWNALDKIHKSIKTSAPVIVFIPTVNQIEKLLAYIDNKYVIQEISELIKREWEPRKEALRPTVRTIGHTGFIVLLRTIK
ncbi:MAG: tRNA (adenine-N1)-methyltransferase [Caldisphaera sp.]|jgi:tRNA (adenine57-N1/adenine58-N1)-methyltransferase|uniref:tRNA (adenine-N1)-methyltransferase n=1 Tax=Caldisphaera sp. TaxID=2060322 RepID=UPI0039792FF5